MSVDLFQQSISLSNGGSFKMQLSSGVVLITLSDGSSTVAVKMIAEEAKPIASCMALLQEILRRDSTIPK